MGFDWRGYFDQAEDLKINHLGGKEAALRSACSRYYYAAFHRALEYAVKNTGFKPEGNGNDHGALITHLAWTRANAGRQLNVLRRYRNEADYKTSIDDPRLEAISLHAKTLASQVIGAFP